MSKKYEYDAVLHELPDSGGAYVPFPWDVREVFGKGRVKVRASFDGIPYDGSIVNMGVKNPDGSVCYIIGVLKSIRTRLNKHSGDMIHVVIEERESAAGSGNSSVRGGIGTTEKSKQTSEAMWKCPKCGRSFSREGQSHYCGKIETVDAYIEAQAEAVRPFLNEVRQILREAVPEAEEKISWSMPTYWKGRNLIHFAASKKHLGLYPGDEAVTAFAERLSDYDVSKGTIRIPYTKPLPRELIADIARWCWEKYGKQK